METIFWGTLAAFCALALAVEFSLRVNEHMERAPKPHDPYRLERFRNGEPPAPDELP